MELDRPEEENEVDEEQTIVISKNGKIAPYCLYDSRICGEWYQQFIVNDGSNSSTPSSSLSAVSVALQHLDSLMKLHPEYTVSDLVKQPETEGKETKEDEEEAKSITSEQFQVSKMTAIDAITTSHTSDPATSSPSPPALAPPPTVKKLSLHLLRLISSPHLCKQQGKCTNHNEWQSIRVWDAEIQGMNKVKYRHVMVCS